MNGCRNASSCSRKFKCGLYEDDHYLSEKHPLIHFLFGKLLLRGRQFNRQRHWRKKCARLIQLTTSYLSRCVLKKYVKCPLHIVRDFAEYITIVSTITTLKYYFITFSHSFLTCTLVHGTCYIVLSLDAFHYR